MKKLIEILLVSLFAYIMAGCVEIYKPVYTNVHDEESEVYIWNEHFWRKTYNFMKNAAAASDFPACGMK